MSPLQSCEWVLPPVPRAGAAAQGCSIAAAERCCPHKKQIPSKSRNVWPTGGWRRSGHQQDRPNVIDSRGFEGKPQKFPLSGLCGTITARDKAQKRAAWGSCPSSPPSHAQKGEGFGKVLLCFQGASCSCAEGAAAVSCPRAGHKSSRSRCPGTVHSCPAGAPSASPCAPAQLGASPKQILHATLSCFLALKRKRGKPSKIPILLNKDAKWTFDHSMGQFLMSACSIGSGFHDYTRLQCMFL